MKHEVFILGQTIEQKARTDGREARGNEEREKREDCESNFVEYYSMKGVPEVCQKMEFAARLSSFKDPKFMKFS